MIPVTVKPVNKAIEKKGKGRPIGSLGKPYGNSPWQPKKWKVAHEMVVYMHINGKSNIEIAKESNRSPMWVSWVINCPKAKEIIEKVRDSLPKETIEARLKYVLEKSSERLVDFISDDRIFENAPIAAIDRTMKAMEMIDSKLRANGGNNTIVKETTERTLILTSEDNVSRLLEAMNKSDEVTQKHRLSLVSG